MEADERRSAILAAAVRVFGEQPYGSVQMAAAAEEAGVTRGVDHETLTQDQVREIVSETRVALAERIIR